MTPWNGPNKQHELVHARCLFYHPTVQKVVLRTSYSYHNVSTCNKYRKEKLVILVATQRNVTVIDGSQSSSTLQLKPVIKYSWRAARDAATHMRLSGRNVDGFRGNMITVAWLRCCRVRAGCKEINNRCSTTIQLPDKTSQSSSGKGTLETRLLESDGKKNAGKG